MISGCFILFLWNYILTPTRECNWPVWLIQVKFSGVSQKVLMAYEMRLKGMGIKKEH
jgi:hypothetical protein